MNSLKEVTLGGVKQWIYVTGTRPDNPILLVLHGGPGFAMLPLFHESVAGLEQKFTVVNWDQRGCGKSYSKNIPKNTMTLKQMVEDAHELTILIKEQYHVPKIYLLGHSFGTVIGVKLAELYPDDYYAYIGVGQVISFAKNEQGSYDFALSCAKNKQDLRAIKQLTKVGRPDSQGDYRIDSGYDITSHWVEHFGGTLHNQSTLDSIYDLIWEDPLYTGDNRKIQKGYDFSQALFDDQAVRTFDLSKKKHFPIPIYLIAGKYDYETPSNLVKDFYDGLETDHKKYIEFENSAHFPFYEEPTQFILVLENLLAPDHRS